MFMLDTFDGRLLIQLVILFGALLALANVVTERRAMLKYKGDINKKDWICKIGWHHWKVLRYSPGEVFGCDSSEKRICTKCGAKWNWNKP